MSTLAYGSKTSRWSRCSVCTCSVWTRILRRLVAVSLPLLLAPMPASAHPDETVSSIDNTLNPSTTDKPFVPVSTKTHHHHRPSALPVSKLSSSPSPSPSPRSLASEPDVVVVTLPPVVAAITPHPSGASESGALSIKAVPTPTVVEIPLPAIPNTSRLPKVSPTWQPTTSISPSDTPPTQSNTLPPYNTAIDAPLSSNIMYRRAVVIPIVTIVPLVALLCMILVYYCYRTRKRRLLGMKYDGDDTESLTNSDRAMSQLSIVEVSALKARRGSIFSMVEKYRSVASSVESSLHSVSSNLSSIRSSWRERIKPNELQSSRVPDILKSPQAPLAFLSPHCMGTLHKEGEYDPDLMVEDYILRAPHSSSIKSYMIEYAPEMENPFVVEFRKEDRRSELTRRDSEMTLVMEPAGMHPEKPAKPLSYQLRQTVGEMQPANRHSVAALPVLAPLPAIHRGSGNRWSRSGDEDPPGLMAGGGREGRVRSISEASKSTLFDSLRTMVSHSSAKNMSAYPFPYPYPYAASRLDRCGSLKRHASNSSAYTKATTATTGSGSSDASYYLCEGCRVGGDSGVTLRGSCRSCGRTKSEGSVISDDSGDSEGSLSRFL